MYTQKVKSGTVVVLPHYGESANSLCWQAAAMSAGPAAPTRSPPLTSLDPGPGAGGAL